MVILRKNEKQNPQYLHFCCGMIHLNFILKKLGKTFQSQKLLLKTEVKHDDVDGNDYKD